MPLILVFQLMWYEWRLKTITTTQTHDASNWWKLFYLYLLVHIIESLFIYSNSICSLDVYICNYLNFIQNHFRYRVSRPTSKVPITTTAANRSKKKYKYKYKRKNITTIRDEKIASTFIWQLAHINQHLSVCQF